MRINRGKSSLNALAEKAFVCGAEKIIVSDRWKGGLGKIQLFELGNVGLVRVYPTLYVKKLKLHREFGHIRTKKVKSLVVQASNQNPIGVRRLAIALSNFLNVSKLPIKRALSGDAVIMSISLNPAQRMQITFLQTTPKKIEIGPQITISHLIWTPRK